MYLKVVILAGGLGTRLSEETGYHPKPMVDIGGRPIIWHIMKLYSQYGIKDFIICCGYKGYIIKEYFTNYHLHTTDFSVNLYDNRVTLISKNTEDWNVSLIDTGEATETGGRLKRVSEFLDDTFCMTYGDGLGDINISKLLKQHKGSGAKATMTAVKPPGRFGSLKLEGTRVVDFLEKPDGDGGWINGGFFVLEPSVLNEIDDDSAVWERKPLETLAASGHLQSYFHTGFWRCMDTLRDKLVLNELWDSNDAPWKCW